ncbi:MAG: TonB-dependent receptor plug domain-containing protein [Bacteroidetes bacterium]|nr:TonB-dependent receptor plug domain-containing protein [Bacteroidota bacterium]
MSRGVLRSLLLLIIALGFQSSAKAQCNQLDSICVFSCTKITRENALNKFAEQFHLRLNYPSNSLDNDLISVDYKSKTGREVLKAIVGSNFLSVDCQGNNSLVLYISKKFNYVVAGFLRDEETGAPILGALLINGSSWVETDADGHFILSLNKTPADVEIYHPGYKSTVRRVDSSGGDEHIYFWRLKADALLTETVVNIFDSILFVGKTGGVNVNMSEVEKIPSISGSPGILNSLRFIPGFQSTLEVNGGMIVRGGSKDQNLVLLDGMDLYNPMHLFGLFSVFGQNSIQSVEFYKGAFPAKYGGRLSSVLDVRTKQGDFQKWHANLDFNPVLFEASVNGPIKKGKTSLLISGRRSFTDFFPLFYEQIQKQNQLSRFKYYFFDLTSTINHRFSERSSLYLTNYIGGDKGYIRGKYDTGNSNIKESNNDEFLQANWLSTLGWKMWVSKTFDIHAIVGYSRYVFDHENSYNLTIDDEQSPYSRITKLNHQSRVEDWKSGVYFHFVPSSKSVFRTGFEYIRHTLTPSRLSYFLQENDFIPYDTLFLKRKADVNEGRFFLEHRLNLKKVRLMTGIHYANFDNNANYSSLQPRMSLVYEPGTKNKLETGFAQTTQFILSVPNNLLGIPIDIWIPVDSNIAPQKCTSFNIGYSRKIGKNSVFRIDAYHKHFDNVVEFRSGVVDFVAEWDKALLTGKSRSNGIEFLLKKEKGKFNGWLGYTLSKTERSMPQIQNGAWFPFQFDRRHDFNVVLNYQPTKSIVIGCTWTYASGHYLTTPETQFLIDVEGKRYLIQQYGSKNNLKLPAYHRLDLGVHYYKSNGNARETWSFTVYNAYNRQNVYYVNSSVNASGTVAFHPISILPVLPSINYAISF